MTELEQPESLASVPCGLHYANCTQRAHIHSCRLNLACCEHCYDEFELSIRTNTPKFAGTMDRYFHPVQETPDPLDEQLKFLGL